jgi:hypothetical protein
LGTAGDPGDRASRRVQIATLKYKSFEKLPIRTQQKEITMKQDRIAVEIGTRRIVSGLLPSYIIGALGA